MSQYLEFANQIAKNINPDLTNREVLAGLQRISREPAAYGMTILPIEEIAEATRIILKAHYEAKKSS